MSCASACAAEEPSAWPMLVGLVPPLEGGGVMLQGEALWPPGEAGDAVSLDLRPLAGRCTSLMGRTRWPW